MARVIIAGGRDFKDYELLERKLDIYLSRLENIEIITSGGRNGTETLAKKYAKKHNIICTELNIKWSKLKFPKQTRETTESIVRASDVMVLFDGGDKKDAIVQMFKSGAIKYRMPYKAVKYAGTGTELQKPVTPKQEYVINCIQKFNPDAPIFRGATAGEAGIYISKYMYCTPYNGALLFTNNKIGGLYET